MGRMNPIVAVLLVVVALAAGWLLATRRRATTPAAEPAPRPEPVDVAALVAQARADARDEARAEAARAAAEQQAALQATFAQALTTLQQQSHAERDAVVQQLATMAKDQVGAQVAAGQADLAAKKEVIGTQLDQIKDEMRAELDRLGKVVVGLGERSAEQFGQVDQSLRAHAEIAQHLCRRRAGEDTAEVEHAHAIEHARHHAGSVTAAVPTVTIFPAPSSAQTLSARCRPPWGSAVADSTRSTQVSGTSS